VIAAVHRVIQAACYRCPHLIGLVWECINSPRSAGCVQFRQTVGHAGQERPGLAPVGRLANSTKGALAKGGVHGLAIGKRNIAAAAPPMEAGPAPLPALQAIPALPQTTVVHSAEDGVPSVERIEIEAHRAPA
jgi:hypothetical protein